MVCDGLFTEARLLFGREVISKMRQINECSFVVSGAVRRTVCDCLVQTGEESRSKLFFTAVKEILQFLGNSGVTFFQGLSLWLRPVIHIVSECRFVLHSIMVLKYFSVFK